MGVNFKKNRVPKCRNSVKFRGPSEIRGDFRQLSTLIANVSETVGQNIDNRKTRRSKLYAISPACFGELRYTIKKLQTGVWARLILGHAMLYAGHT